MHLQASREESSAAMNPRFLALIPARAGSKGIPLKNWQKFGQTSLVERTINYAVQDAAIEYVFVSSDYLPGRELAEKLGAVFLERSPAASTDEATADDVVRDFLKSPRAHMFDIDDYIVYLQPTSPFRTDHHIRQAIQMVVSDHLASLVSVSLVEESPHRMYTLDDLNRLEPIIAGASSSANRQTLPTVFKTNGAIYIFRISEFLKQDRFPIINAHAFMMDSASSTDLDTPKDWNLALGRLL